MVLTRKKSGWVVLLYVPFGLLIEAPQIAAFHNKLLDVERLLNLWSDVCEH